MEIIERCGGSLREAYWNRKPGGHWFDESTIQFFQSHIHKIVEVGMTWLFVTSEKPPGGDRAYSVRWMSETGSIETLGKFCSMTENEANDLLQEETKRLREGR